MMVASNVILNQNVEDWVLALGILVFIVIDLVILSLNVIIGEALGALKVILVPNKENPRTVAGVRQQI